MTSEVKILLLSNMFIALAVGLFLIFYRYQRKTYHGYLHLTLAALAIALGYSALIIRPDMADWLMVMITNFAIILAAILRLDGVGKFIVGRDISRLVYLLPPALILSEWFILQSLNSITIGNMLVAIGILVISLRIFFIFKLEYGKGGKSTYRLAALINLTFGFLMMGRAFYLLANPGIGFLDAKNYHEFFLIWGLIYEMSWCFLFMLMNAQRLEDELEKSRIELSATVDRLEKANSEVKILNGMLPICSHCKKIRDDGGYWNQIESYIHTHSEASFSHSICPECASCLYPELYPAGAQSGNGLK